MPKANAALMLAFEKRCESAQENEYELHKQEALD